MFGVGFKSYKPSAFDLIALRQRDKISINRHCTTVSIDSRRTVLRCLEQGLNLGVRLRADQLVIDVDPRHGGRDRPCSKSPLMLGTKLHKPPHRRGRAMLHDKPRLKIGR